MTELRIVGLETDYVETLRARRLDRFGNRLEAAPAEPRWPCRHCLEEIEEGAGSLVPAHSPFPAPGPYSEVGPIFICAEECAPYGETGRIPPVVRDRLVVVRGYGHDDRIVYGTGEIVAGPEVPDLAKRLLARPEVAYLHVRTARNGCYLCRIERG